MKPYIVLSTVKYINDMEISDLDFNKISFTNIKFKISTLY